MNRNTACVLISTRCCLPLFMLGPAFKQDLGDLRTHLLSWVSLPGTHALPSEVSLQSPPGSPLPGPPQAFLGLPPHTTSSPLFPNPLGGGLRIDSLQINSQCCWSIRLFRSCCQLPVSSTPGSGKGALTCTQTPSAHTLRCSVLLMENYMSAHTKLLAFNEFILCG